MAMLISHSSVPCSDLANPTPCKCDFCRAGCHVPKEITDKQSTHKVVFFQQICWAAHCGLPAVTCHCVWAVDDLTPHVHDY